MRVIFLNDREKGIQKVYSESIIEKMDTLFELDKTAYSKDYVLKHKGEFDDVRFAFSTWGMPVFSKEEIKEYFPALECVFYAAGTVQAFARPFLECGVKVFSAWAANAVPVAEYTLAQILLANKGFYRLSSMITDIDSRLESKEKFKGYPGNYGEYIGIIGAGMIGKKVIELLKPFNLNIKVFDPFLPDEKAKELGVKKCSLEELFKTCFVVSNHLANNEQTKGMLNYSLFSTMRENATFINTGRGAQVVEDDLIKVLRERKDIMAILDVTLPEPPEKGHPFYSLENCILTPHIAGSAGDEVYRMAEYMIDEYKKYINGEPYLYEVTEKMLETMA